jgi:hypothetical protein
MATHWWLRRAAVPLECRSCRSQSSRAAAPRGCASSAGSDVRRLRGRPHCGALLAKRMSIFAVRHACKPRRPASTGRGRQYSPWPPPPSRVQAPLQSPARLREPQQRRSRFSFAINFCQRSACATAPFQLHSACSARALRALNSCHAYHRAQVRPARCSR